MNDTASRLARLIEANTNAYLLSFGQLPGAWVHHSEDLVWVDSGIPDATFNSVVFADFQSAMVDAGITRVQDHFRRQGRPFTWHVGPSTRPTDLDRSLLEHGLSFSEEEPGMALDLASVPDDVRDPEGLTIEVVHDRPGLAEWVGVWLFGAPPDMQRLYTAALNGRGIGDGYPWRYFLGRLGGEAVAISELFLDAEAAGVQYVVTLPEVRGRGIGAAMTLRVVREGRAAGRRIAVLTSSPDGFGVYRRIGFKEYCRFRRYEG